MKILRDIRNCDICSDVLPLAPKPILQVSRKSRLLIVGQAPGLLAHESGKPWNDASGIRLRHWLSMQNEDFYNPGKTAIVPMGLCYPGRGKSGDNPPRPECQVRWLEPVLAHLKHLEVTVLVGSYAASHFLGKEKLDKLIQIYAVNEEPVIVLPHPSPRNNIWLSKNLWFENETLPAIRSKLRELQHKI